METVVIHEYLEVNDIVKENRTYEKEFKKDYVVYEIEKMFENKLRGDKVYLEENTLTYMDSDIMNCDSFSVTFPPKYKNEILEMVNGYTIKRLKSRLELKRKEREYLDDEINRITLKLDHLTNERG